MEIWKPIPKYSNYEISNYGNIRKLGKLLNIGIDSNGYKRINLQKQGKQTTFRLHKLLALVFIENPNNYKIINHKDGNKLNNDLNNLEWCTHSHNTKEAFRLGLMVGNKAEKHGRAILNKEKVSKIRNNEIDFKTAKSEYNISKTQFYRVKKGIGWD